MRITYVKHSSFLVENSEAALLFDYFDGELPSIDKPLFVFASHFHRDHFSDKVFDLMAQEYFLSDSIKLKQIPEAFRDRVKRLHEGESFRNEFFSFRTFGSTDAGISFLVKFNQMTFYHAGDNNDWSWREEEYKTMPAKYESIIEKLPPLDFAFTPVDPRLEEGAFQGVKRLVKKNSVKVIYPMHMWGDYSMPGKAQTVLGSDIAIKQINAPLWSEEINK
jgi:hypothetical protein